jgi:hypothetical protein
MSAPDGSPRSYTATACWRAKARSSRLGHGKALEHDQVGRAVRRARGVGAVTMNAQSHAVGPFADRVDALGTETVFAVSAEAAAFSARGAKVHPFHMGDLKHADA